MAYIWYRPQIVAIKVCLLFNFAVVFNFNVFSFPPSKAESLGDVSMNRKNAENCSPLFEFVYCVMERDIKANRQRGPNLLRQ